jgi:hypothetical protein
MDENATTLRRAPVRRRNEAALASGLLCLKCLLPFVDAILHGPGLRGRARVIDADCGVCARSAGVTAG